MIAQHVFDRLTDEIQSWFSNQLDREPYSDSYEDEEEWEDWDDYINECDWEQLEGGRSLWRRFYNASSSQEVIDIYNSYFGESQAKKEEEQRQLAEMLEKLKPYADTVNVVYEFAKASGICATPEGSMWINKFLCDTLISDC